MIINNTTEPTIKKRFFARLSCGGEKEIIATDRKEATRKAHNTGYQVYSIRQAGKILVK